MGTGEDRKRGDGENDNRHGRGGDNGAGSGGNIGVRGGKTTSRPFLCVAFSPSKPSDPALEGVQGRFHFPRQNPGLRPEEEDLLCHGDVKHP